MQNEAEEIIDHYNSKLQAPGDILPNSNSKISGSTLHRAPATVQNDGMQQQQPCLYDDEQKLIDSKELNNGTLVFQKVDSNNANFENK